MNRYLLALVLELASIFFSYTAAATDSYQYSPGLLRHWGDLDGHTGSDPEVICKLPAHRWQRDGKTEYLHIDGYSAYDSYFVYYCHNGADYLLPISAPYECPDGYQRDSAYPIQHAKACYKLAPPQVDSDQRPGSPEDDDPVTMDRSGGNGGAGASCPGDSGVVGDPVNTAYGNKFERITDYRAVGASPLQFTRFYDSHMTRNGSLGSHWRHFYDRQIERVSETRAKAWRADGKGISFTLNNGVWTAPGNSVLRLQAEVDTAGNFQGWRLLTSRDATETYDAQGRLLKITERSGISQQLAYDGNGRLLSVSDNFGRKLGFAYDGQGRVLQLTNPAGATYRYDYDGAGNLMAVTDPDHRQTRYLYENTGLPHALTGVLDGNGLRIDNTRYASDGKVVYNDRGSNIEALSIGYDESGSHVVDSNGASRTFTFGLIQGVMKSLGLDRSCPGCVASSRQLERDANGNITSRVDFNGISTRYRYDMARNLETGRTEAAGTAQERSISISWHARFRLPTQIIIPGRRTDMAYDEAGNLSTLTVTDTASGEQRQWQYRYGPYGLLTSATPPSGETLSYAYDSNGNLLATTTALGLVTQYSGYDANGHVGRIVYPSGRTLDFSYDATGHLLNRRETVDASIGNELPGWWQQLLNWMLSLFGAAPANPLPHPSTGPAITSYRYDNAALLTDIISPDNSRQHYDYDTAYRLVQHRDTLGNITQILRDPMGNITETTTYAGSTLLEKHRFTRDALGRLTQVTGNAGQLTTFRYDNEGELLTRTNALGQQTAWTHDALYRTTSVTDAHQQSTQITYGALDQLLTVTDARGNLTAYTPNAFGEVTQEQSPDRGRTQQVFTQGRLRTVTDARGVTHQYSYDGDGRISRISAPHSQQEFRYDEGRFGQGRLTSFSDSSGQTRYRYNSQGLVTEKIAIINNGATLIQRYSYTLGGQPKEIATPGKHLIAYGYDSEGRISSLSVDGKSLLSQIQFGAHGISGWTWSNNTPRNESRDLDGRLVQISSGNALQRQYGFDVADRLVSLVDSKAGVNDSYSYDAVDRLLSQRSGNSTTSYSYDSVGNRQRRQTTITGRSITTSYTTDSASNRLLGENMAGTNHSYSYLASGQTSSDNRYVFRYDDDGRLSDISRLLLNSPVQHNVYNALGQRVLKNGRRLLVYAYDEAGHLQGEYLPGGIAVREYVWLGERLVGMLSAQHPGALLQVHTDHLGTPRAVSNGNTVLWRWEGDAFGGSAANETVAGTLKRLTLPLRFPGQYYDEETGLHYNYFRDYKPGTGRYMESDPIGLKGGINTFSYVQNSPLIYRDPFGLDFGFGVDSDGAGGNGHTSLYFQNSSGQWNRYDQGAVGNAGTSSVIMGGDTPAGVTIQPIDTPPADAILYDTTPEQDDLITRSANNSAAFHNMGLRQYNLYSNNCTDAAVDVINSSGYGGGNIPNPGSVVRPNSWIKILR